MVRVLEVCESYGGGVKKHVDYLDKYLNRTKVSTYYLVSGVRKDTVIPSNFIRDDDLSGYKNLLKIIKSIHHIHQLVKDNDIQIIHAHSTIAAVLVYIYSIFHHDVVTTIYTPHAYLSEKHITGIKRKIIILIEKIYIKRFDYVVNVSEQERQHALDCKLSDERKQLVIKNGIVNLTKPVIRNHLTKIVNIARCDKQKNPFEFIEIAKCCKNINNLQFTFVGNGDLLDQCKQRVAKLGLTNIQFVGFSNSVSKWLTDSDLFLSTSLYEGLPFSVIEAEAAGLPVILSNVVGHQELFHNNGYMYKLGDTEAVANWIDQVKLDSEKLSRFSHSSIKIYEKNFRAEIMIKKIEDLYLRGK